MAEDVDVAVMLGAGVMLAMGDVLACKDELDEAVILGEGVEDCDTETDALLEWLKEYKGDHVAIEDAVDVTDTGLSEVWGVSDFMADGIDVFDGHEDILGMLLIE